MIAFASVSLRSFLGSMACVAIGLSTMIPIPFVDAAEERYFNRISTFNICTQIDPNCNTDDETNAETIWYFKKDDSYHLVYSNSESESVGFVDISDPTEPVAAGNVEVGGEPTTVRVIGNYAVVGVNTSPNYTNPDGTLTVIDTSTMEIVHTIDLPGQPDAVDVSKINDESDGPFYLAIAIENERDEDLGSGAPPQMPPGYLSIVDIPTSDDLLDPSSWTIRTIELANTTAVMEACLYPEDPEPEYVTISEDNTQVIMSLQENNCYIVFDLESGDIVRAFTAGKVDELPNIDMTEDGIINQIETGIDILREPDGIAWIGGTKYFASANEGDLDGGSRGWSIYDSDDGSVVYDSGSELEWWSVRTGHYPEERSENKGNEPENVFYKRVGDKEFVFVLSERSNLVFVYMIASDELPTTDPTLFQVLPSGGVGPEGITVIDEIELVAIANEKDARDDKFRSTIALFQLDSTTSSQPDYPTLISALRGENQYIPFSALSGLAAASPFGWGMGDGQADVLYSIEDSFYNKNRIIKINVSSFPAIVEAEHRITDSSDVLKGCLNEFISNNPDSLTVNVGDVINDDHTVNIDPEGIAVSTGGGFWVVSEGKGTIGDEGKPFETPNLLLKTNEEGDIQECFTLPQDGSWPEQLRFGFEGVAEAGKYVVVALQRAWGDEDNPRLAIYDTETNSWGYTFYPLDEPESQNGGWVGLSDIAPIGTDGEFMVLERDNQGGVDAVIKRLYKINLGDFSFQNGETIDKTLFQDLVPNLLEGHGNIIEKVEGLAITADGSVYVNTDNDGVDDSSGEQVLLHVASLDTISPSASPVEDIKTSSPSSRPSTSPTKKVIKIPKKSKRNVV